jgi:hypothetical protein
MIVHLQKLDGFVTVDSVSRAVDLSDLPAEVLTVTYNTQTGVGFISTGSTESYFGKTVFNQLYAKYLQAWRTMAGTPERTLEQVKADKTAQINSIRDTLEQTSFPYLDTDFDSNPISVSRIAIAVQAAQAALGAEVEFEIEWTDKHNNVLTLSAIDMVSMPVALANYANTLHQHAKTKKTLINAATTITEVEAISWGTI